MKTLYIDIMEKVIAAYSHEHIQEYIDDVKKNGLSEHGFPRLTADLGILIAHGRYMDLKDTFEEMMDICCAQIPTALAEHASVGNDFSVKEIVFALLEVEEKKVYPEEKINSWRKMLGEINPYTCYKVIAPKPPVRIGNWAAYAAASEQLRKYAGIGNEDEFIDNQIASQILSFDENGLYRDPHEPMLYDLATRMQLAIALFYGYDGANSAKLDEYLKLGGKPTLLMQSVTGEIPFGGRSNQFLYNEAILAAVCEYEAVCYKKKGDNVTAGQFKAAANLAVSALLKYIEGDDLHHIKNYFPRDSFHGCEGYAYFNKYMVTVASFIYVAYLFADDTIEPGICPAREGNHIYRTSEYFHKTMCKFGEYFVEYDTNADFHYDANGLGRIHRKGAPSTICLSVPFAKSPSYRLLLENPSDLSICGGVCDDENYVLACEPGTEYTLLEQAVTESHAELIWLCKLNNGTELIEKCVVSAEGVKLSYSLKAEAGEEEKSAKDMTLCCVLPVFKNDGEQETEVQLSEQKATVSYKGWECSYTTEALIKDAQKVYANRNGYYRMFTAEQKGSLEVSIVIERSAEN